MDDIRRLILECVDETEYEDLQAIQSGYRRLRDRNGRPPDVADLDYKSNRKAGGKDVRTGRLAKRRG